MKTYLEERIEWYDDNYRNGNALISDKQFDQLEKNLLRTNPDCDYFKKKNKLVLPSLEKDSIDEFLKGLLVDTRLLIGFTSISPKTRYLVGISLKQISSFLLWTVKYEDKEKWIIDKPSWIPSQKNLSHRIK